MIFNLIRQSLVIFFIISFVFLAGCGGNGDDGGGNGGGGTNYSVTLAWDPPTTNADGSALTDLAGFKIYYRNPGENYNFNNPAATIEDPTVKTHTFAYLPAGQYYFVAKAFDFSGNESEPSNEAPPDSPLVIPR